jgi:hypothetical protein
MPYILQYVTSPSNTDFRNTSNGGHYNATRERAQRFPTREDIHTAAERASRQIRDLYYRGVNEADPTDVTELYHQGAPYRTFIDVVDP